MADDPNKNKPATAPTAGAKAAPAAKKEPKPARYDPKGTITMLANKEGKKYGKDANGKPNEGGNPKRASAKAHAHFENYREGMTIADLATAFEKSGGSMNSNLDWDIKHGFINYVPPKTA